MLLISMSVTNQSRMLGFAGCVQAEPPGLLSTNHKDSFNNTQVKIHLTKVEREQSPEEIGLFLGHLDQRSNEL